MKARLLRLARSKAGTCFLRLAFRRFPRFLPVRRLYLSPTAIAFEHPLPSYDSHILILPLPPISGLDNLTLKDAPLLAEIHRIALLLVVERQLQPGWRLVVNGGGYQEVGMLHFHLIY